MNSSEHTNDPYQGQIHVASFGQQKDDKKKSKVVLFGVIAVLLVLGIAGIATFSYFNSNKQVSLTQQNDALAWRPTSVDATCTSVRVVSSSEKVPFSYDFTFTLNQSGRTGSLQHTFASTPVNGVHKVNAEMKWTDFGAEGVQFSSLLRTNDEVSWTAIARFTEDGKPKTENHTGKFSIYDTNCNAASPTPVATVTAMPTSTPTAVPTMTATPHATATSVATVSASPSDSATPEPTLVSEVTPTASPRTDLTDNRSDNQGCSVKDCSGNKVPDKTAVADANTAKLPQAGVNMSYIFIGFGMFSIAISFMLLYFKKRY